MLSVLTFLEENHQVLKDMKSYQALLGDQDEYRARLKINMANDLIAKRILNNDYGTPCDMRMAKMFRDWCRERVGVE